MATKQTKLAQSKRTDRRMVDVPGQVWRDVKVRAALDDKTMGEVVTAALQRYLRAA